MLTEHGHGGFDEFYLARRKHDLLLGSERKKEGGYTMGRRWPCPFVVESVIAIVIIYVKKFFLAFE